MNNKPSNLITQNNIHDTVLMIKNSWDHNEFFSYVGSEKLYNKFMFMSEDYKMVYINIYNCKKLIDRIQVRIVYRGKKRLGNLNIPRVGNKIISDLYYMGSFLSKDDPYIYKFEIIIEQDDLIQTQFVDFLNKYIFIYNVSKGEMHCL